MVEDFNGYPSRSKWLSVEFWVQNSPRVPSNMQLLTTQAVKFPQKLANY